ncbi:MAG: hypothetical protein KC656_01820 [Myxococcales bacterium]|nr:hypothetical protein [Myxococcales bacterium]
MHDTVPTRTTIIASVLALLTLPGLALHSILMWASSRGMLVFFEHQRRSIQEGLEKMPAQSMPVTPGLALALLATVLIARLLGATRAPRHPPERTAEGLVICLGGRPPAFHHLPVGAAVGVLTFAAYRVAFVKPVYDERALLVDLLGLGLLVGVAWLAVPSPAQEFHLLVNDHGLQLGAKNTTLEGGWVRRRWSLWGCSAVVVGAGDGVVLPLDGATQSVRALVWRLAAERLAWRDISLWQLARLGAPGRLMESLWWLLGGFVASTGVSLLAWWTRLPRHVGPGHIWITALALGTVAGLATSRRSGPVSLYEGRDALLLPQSLPSWGVWALHASTIAWAHATFWGALDTAASRVQTPAGYTFGVVGGGLLLLLAWGVTAMVSTRAIEVRRFEIVVHGAFGKRRFPRGGTRCEVGRGRLVLTRGRERCTVWALGTRQRALEDFARALP